MDYLGGKIKEILEASDLTVAEFARRISTTRENVYTIFKRHSIDTEMLARISLVLNFNFFDLVTPEKFKEEKQAEQNRILERLQFFEMENKYLKTINNLENPNSNPPTE